MTNIDLTTLLGATVDRAVMAFIDKIGSKYDLPTRELADLWDQTSTGGPVPKVKKALNKLEDSESSSVSEVKVALKKAPAKKVDDGTESSESELKPISRRGKKGDNKPVRRGKKVVESDDSPPPKKKAPVKKKAPARGKRRAYEEVDAPKGGAGYPEPPEDLVFLKDTNYILHDGKVVAGWSKKGFMVLNTVHEKSLNSEVNQDIEYEKLSKDELDELFDMVKVNAKIAESKPPVKRKGKK